MHLRKEQEKFEEEHLSKFAAKSARSRGRRKKEEPCMIRTEFQRDRDRIVYSKAFRRLKHKTQVFIKPEGDHFRTRLTHALEVAQISKTIARVLMLNEDLTEAIALGHDLGHSPFGHAGESALDEVYKEYDPDAGFKHNEQSLRVVDLLEKKDGLNLTYEVRNGILRHAKGRSSLMFEEFNKDLAETLEGEIVRISDRVAYINHDIDDAVRAGIIKDFDLPSGPVRILGKTLTARINLMVTDIVKNSWDSPHINISKEIAEAIEVLKEFMFERVYTNSPAKADEEKSKRLVKELFHFLMKDENLIYIPRYLVIKGFDLTDIKQRARAVCDYISGMTDRYALSEFERIFVPRGWV